MKTQFRCWVATCKPMAALHYVHNIHVATCRKRVRAQLFDKEAPHVHTHIFLPSTHRREAHTGSGTYWTKEASLNFPVRHTNPVSTMHNL